MDDQVGEERLLERRREPLYELVRQPADEADRVRDEVPAPVLLERTRGRVERLEEAIVHGHVRVRERVQKRRLPRVRIARKSDNRDRGRPPALALRLAAALERAEPFLQDGDPAPRKPPVGLELRLPRPASPRADAAARPLEVAPHASHAREVVLELGEFDLELALGAHGVQREDVEDELRPVEDADVERLLETPSFPFPR
jgi:hypothetical protein